MDYTLYENKLTADIADDFVARVVNTETKNREDVIAEITGPGSILKKTECNAVIENYWEKIISSVETGAYYRDEHVSVRIDILGTFLGENDRFDAERHQLNITLHPTAKMNAVLPNIPLTYVKPEKIVPKIETVFDWGSASTNQNLTPNDTLEIKGTDLKVYSEYEEQGIYFLNVGDGTETKAETIRTNEPKTLTLRVPALTAGTYRIEVRNAFWKGTNLRVGITNFALTVE